MTEQTELVGRGGQETFTKAQVNEILRNRLEEQENRSWRGVVDQAVQLLPQLTAQLGQQAALLTDISTQMDAARKLFHSNLYTPDEAAALHRQARIGARLHWMSGWAGKTIAGIFAVAVFAQTVASLYTALFGAAHPIAHP